MTPPAVDGVCRACGFDYDVGGLGEVVSSLSNILTKLDLPPAEDDHRRVLAVLQWVRS